jgi:2-hydroxychromene-2-carboxylate isomerase
MTADDRGAGETRPDRLVKFHLDFVSPYTWLALMQSERFALEHRVLWEPCPVVYAKLLDANGLVGPVETPAKRRYTFHDVARSAHRLGLRLSGPPQHPFRSLEALRTLQVFRRDPRALRLAVMLSDACWGEGRDLTDAGVLRDVVARAGLDTEGLEERIASPEAKQGLRESTDEALVLGVFGVPTFLHDGELFWGHDRLDLLAERLAGRVPPARELTGNILDRPRGADRKSTQRA